jgi:putative FmdB family regulatory protein
MPLYEYLCESCGERLERLQKFADPPPVECPACGQPGLRRLLSAPAFQFKGTGWYVTDYARQGKGTDRDAGGESGEGKKGEETGGREEGGGEGKRSEEKGGKEEGGGEGRKGEQKDGKEEGGKPASGKTSEGAGKDAKGGAAAAAKAKTESSA